MKLKTILVTGATGFLGSKIVQQLFELSYNIVIIKRSTSNVYRIKHLLPKCIVYDIDVIPIKNIFKENTVDVIIHTAAAYGRKGENSEQIIEANYTFPLNLLQAAVNAGVKKFINTATSLVPKINEYALYKNKFVDSLNGYTSKIVIQNLILEYFYGPDDDSWKLITMILQKFATNAAFIDFTSGEQKRDFIYIDDVVAAYILLAQQESQLLQFVENFAVGSGNSISIKDLVYLCKKITSNTCTQLNFGSLPNRGEEIANHVCNISVIQKAGWLPKTSLNKGIEITWQFILSKTLSNNNIKIKI